MKKKMPVNRLALIRYTTIDRCLKNRFRRWTLEDLIDACSDSLAEFEGIYQRVSRRTVQLDIQNMRSEKLGYEAPIVVFGKKYYQYSDPGYSITNMPLSEHDVNSLKQITHILKQFKGFTQFNDMDDVLKKIETKILAINNPAITVIDFEKNNDLKGLKYLDLIYDTIINKKVLKIVYQNFTSKKPVVIHLSPYYLKEYRNRWFVLGKREFSEKIALLALDRMLRLKTSNDHQYVENESLDLGNYFQDMIGVTKLPNTKIEHIEFFVDAATAPYVITKPFHPSQQIVDDRVEGVVFSIDVMPNFELEREFLGFGESLTVLKPENLRLKLIRRIEEMRKNYEK